MYLKSIGLPFLLLLLHCASGQQAQPTPEQCRDINSVATQLPALSGCWYVLGMSDWLGTWIATAAKNSVNGEFCEIGEAWGNCFMRLTHSNDQRKIDCASLATNACPYVSPRNRRGIMAGPDGVRVWYAAYAIWFYREFIARIYQQFPTHGEGPYFSNPPGDVLRTFLEREAYPGYDHFALLNSALVQQMNYAHDAGLWTTFDIAGIQTGLLAVLNYTMTDFWTEMGRFDTLARYGGLLQNWSCLQSKCSS